MRETAFTTQFGTHSHDCAIGFAGMMEPRNGVAVQSML